MGVEWGGLECLGVGKRFISRSTLQGFGKKPEAAQSKRVIAGLHACDVMRVCDKLQ